MTRTQRLWSLIVLGLGFLVAPAPVPVLDVPAAIAQGTAIVDFLNVGQGDSILIRSPEGKTALVDAGPSKDVVETLHRLGVTSIDMVVVSHHHFDHYGGMDEVIREFHPTVFMATNSAYTGPTYLNLLKLVQDEEMTVLTLESRSVSRKIEVGTVVLTVLPQPPEDLAEENENSIGLRVQFGDAALLLTGDSEEEERGFWTLNATDLLQGVSVLKLAHHGSRNGTDADWLDLIHPSLAVASVGAGNRYGHPHQETLDLLAARNIPLRRTDQDGTIELRSDGKTWFEVTPNEPSPPAPPSSRPAPTLVNLNTANQDALEALPGIGPALAQRIIDARPFRSVNDLIEVKGIGEKKLDRLRPLVTVR